MEDQMKNKDELLKEIARLYQQLELHVDSNDNPIRNLIHSTPAPVFLHSETNYRSLVDNLREGVLHIDEKMNTILVNPRMAKMLGYTEDEMLGKPVAAFIKEKDFHLFQSKFERRKSDIREQHDFEFVRKDRSTLYAIVETAPIFEEDKFIGAVIGVLDITERRKAEEDLHKLEEIVNASPVVAFLWRADVSWTAEYVTPNASKILGYDAEEFLQGKVFYVQIVHPDDLERLVNEVLSYSQTDVDEFEQVGRVVRPDGSIILFCLK